MLLKLIDPRIVQIFNNTTLMVYGFIYLNFNRNLKLLVPTFILSILLETALSQYFVSERNRRNIYERSISVLNTLASLFVIINVDNPMFYLFAALLAVASKYFFKVKNKHVFNPANFGIVLSLVFVTETYVKIIYTQFASPQSILFWFVLINGLIISIWAKRIILALSYFIFTILFLYFLSPLFGFPDRMLIGPSLSLSGFLFTFFMITDPKTTPDRKLEQVIFGVVCAMIGALLRLNQMVHDAFVALFLTTALYSLANLLRQRKIESPSI